MDTLPPNGLAGDPAVPATPAAPPKPAPAEVTVGSLRFSPQGFGRLTAALAAAQGEFPELPRNKTVDVVKNGNKLYSFRYATLDKILELHRPLLAKQGLAVMQPIGRLPDGALILTTLLSHGESGEWMMQTLPLPEIKGDLQGFGSDITYLRRYALSALLCIAADEDDDGNARKEQAAVERKPAPPAPAPSSARAKLDGFSNAASPPAPAPASGTMPADAAEDWKRGKWSKGWRWLEAALPALPPEDRQGAVDAHAALLHRVAEFSAKSRDAVEKLLRECEVRAPAKPPAAPGEAREEAAGGAPPV